jgi:hypothetical protein
VLAVSLLGCLVQFQFLPILCAIGGYVAFSLWRFGRQRSLLEQVRFGWSRAGVLSRVIVSLLFVVAVGLFVRAYGVNVIRYHSPIPACNTVLTTKDCMQYYTFARNYTAHLQRRQADPNPVRFSAGWLYRLFEYSFYAALNGAVAPLDVLPLPILALTAIAVFSIGVVVLAARHLRILRQYPMLGFLLLTSLFYAAVLWEHNYADFLHYGVKLGINGRYLFPVIIPVMLAIALAYRELLRRRHHFKPWLVAAVFVLCLQGGGALTFIVASDEAWWWREVPFAAVLNRTAQQAVKPWIVNFPLFR